MTAFTLATLIRIFATHCSETHVASYPFSSEVIALIDQTPNDPAVYEQIARDAFTQYVLGKEIDYDQFGCVEEALRILLYRDGRSFRGLMVLADLAYQHPDVSTMGVNALAWLTNYVHSPELPLDRAEARDLLGRVETYKTNRMLAHNAEACADALRERFADLR
jgi:hypothetical protein